MPDPDSSRASASMSAANIAWLADQFITAHGKGNKRTLQIMVAIALAESGGNYLAHNKTPPDDSYGLWQINMYGSLGASRRLQFNLKKNSDLFNPYTNARAANGVLRGQGFKAWSVYSNGRYKTHLDVAWTAIHSPKKPTLDPAFEVNLGDVGEKIDSEIGDELGGVLNPADVLGAIVDDILSFFGQGALRAAGFLGGAALIVIAIVIVAKKGVK